MFSLSLELLMVPFDFLSEENVIDLTRPIHLIKVHAEENTVPFAEEFLHPCNSFRLQPEGELPLESFPVFRKAVQKIPEIICV